MPLTGRAEVLCESAVAPSRSVLNSVSGYVLAPSGKEHCAPTCHGSHNFVKKNFNELQRMAAPARRSPPVGAATPLRTQCKGVRWPRPAQSTAPKPVAASDPTRLERKGGVRRSAFQLPDAHRCGKGSKIEIHFL